MKTTVNCFGRKCVFLLCAFVFVCAILSGCANELNPDPDENKENVSDNEDEKPEPDDNKEIEVSIVGCAQKGQFTKGSQLTAFGMDENLVATGQSFPGTISDDMGNYVISGKTSNRYLELRAEGYYYNEVTGQLDGPLYLDALVRPSTNNANVNVLTTIIKPRVKNIIKSGSSYEVAVKQAQKEFMDFMGYDLDFLDFDKMDITNSSDSDSFLLALACMTQVNKSSAEVAAFIQNLASDFEDGVLENDNIFELKRAADLVNPREVVSNLTAFYQSNGLTDAVVPEFWDYFTDAPKGTYTKILSSRILKGVYDCSSQLQILDSECDPDNAWALTHKYTPMLYIDSVPESYEFDFNNPKWLYGDFELEFITFGNNVSVNYTGGSNNMLWETEVMDDYTYRHKLIVRCNVFNEMLSIKAGDKSYDFSVNGGGELEQLDFSEDKCCLKLNVETSTLLQVFGGGTLVRVNGKYYTPWTIQYEPRTGVVFVPKADVYDIEFGCQNGMTYKSKISDTSAMVACTLDYHPELYTFNLFGPEMSSDKTSLSNYIIINGESVPVHYFNVADDAPNYFQFICSIENVSEVHAEYVANGKTYYGYGEVRSDGTVSFKWLDRPFDQLKAICYKNPYGLNAQGANQYIYYSTNFYSIWGDSIVDGVYAALVPQDVNEFFYMAAELPRVNGTLSSYQVEYNGRSYYEVIWDDVDDSLITTVNVDMTNIPDGYNYILQIFDSKGCSDFYGTSGNKYSYKIVKDSQYRVYFDVFRQVVYEDGITGEVPYGFMENVYVDDGSGELNITLELTDLTLRNWQ